MSAAGRLQTIERLGIIMKFLDAEFVQGFIRMADDGRQQGRHERNGGNLSYRVKPEEVELVKENFEPKEFHHRHHSSRTGRRVFPGDRQWQIFS